MGFFIMRSLLKMALVGFLGCASLGGCTTYTNIPEQSGDVARNDPNDESVREVMAASLAAVASDPEFAKPFEVVLPVGSNVETYTFVVPKVSKVATSASVMSPTEQKPTGLPVLEVRRLRLRGWIAQVDIVRPFSAAQPDGLKQLATVDLKWSPITDWHVEGVRIWRISVDQALKQSPFGPGEHD
jgi:hypothetical protein